MKNNKNYDLDTLFGGNISKLLIGLLGVSVLALVLYFGVSLTSKGTFSAESNFSPGVYCVKDIREKRYINRCEGTEQDSKCYGNVINGTDYGNPESGHLYYYSQLAGENSWECETTDISQYMCDNSGILTYIALCMKYDSNHQISDNVMCGVTEGFLYQRSELSDSGTCLAPGAQVSAGGVVGVQKCDKLSQKVVTIVSCQGNVCYQGPITPRGSNEPGFEAHGYLTENLIDADDPICANNGFKKCYKCTQKIGTHTATSETPDIETVTATESCPNGYTDEKITSCVKNCLYCDDGQVKTFSGIYYGLSCSNVLGGGNYEDTPEVRASLDCTGSGTNPGTNPGVDPGNDGQDVCYRCNPDSSSPDAVYVPSGTNCDTGWSKTRPDCSGNGGNSGNTTLKDCYMCYNGETLHDMLTACTGEWSETVPNCSNNTTKKTCYYCSGGNRLSFELEDSANGDCSKSRLHSGAVADSGLVCYSGTKKCYNDPNKSVGEWVNVVSCDSSDAGYCTLTDGRKVNKSTITDGNGCNVDYNSQTGSSAVIIAWIIGLTAIGYAFYYFRQTNVKEN